LPGSGTLSVVLISRNQERTIGPLVESVRREADEVALQELILVDSASSDRTVEIALGHGVAVLVLPQADWLCASAGRFAGFAATTGEHVLFLDGDMELLPGWLELARRALDSDPRLAAVSGLVTDGERGTPRPPTDPLGQGPVDGVAAWTLPHPAGAALYRRTALLAAGGFNPYLRSDEEPELALRLRARGFRIVAIDRPAFVHHEPVAGGGLAALLARRRRGLFVGHGQVMRALLGRPGFRLLVAERGYALAPLGAGAAGVIALLASAASRRRRWLGGWLAAIVAVLGADAVRRRSPRATALAALNRLLFAEGLIRGITVPVGDPADHPAAAAGVWIRPPGLDPERRS
jgi:glycosyltransferase involved in cell wall biosynthesis